LNSNGFADKISYLINRTEQRKGSEEMMKKDSELFKPLVVTAEKYLRDYCNGKQESDEKAKVALRVLSLYRRILRYEREQKAIRYEWEKLITGVNELKKLTRKGLKSGERKSVKTIKSKPSPRG
jgi:hypothetical protein